MRRKALENLANQIAQLDRERRGQVLEIDEDKLTESEQAFSAIADLKGKKLYRNGWPDFLVVDDLGGTIGVEVKSGSDYVKPEQVRMFSALERAGLTVMVWRPENPRVLSSWRKFAPDPSSERSTNPSLGVPKLPGHRKAKTMYKEARKRR